MTRKEAWRRAKGYLYDTLSGEEADEIIKAIEQEPLEKYIEEIDYLRRYISKLENQVIEQEPKWIPVNERLPEEPGTYMTTINYGKYYGLAVEQRYYYESLGWNDDCVIAWMPLPEPYKAESEDKE
jgi:hypothetical protein